MKWTKWSMLLLLFCAALMLTGCASSTEKSTGENVGEAKTALTPSYTERKSFYGNEKENEIFHLYHL